jgi:hypothetical protein
VRSLSAPRQVLEDFLLRQKGFRAELLVTLEQPFSVAHPHTPSFQDLWFQDLLFQGPL